MKLYFSKTIWQGPLTGMGQRESKGQRPSDGATTTATPSCASTKDCSNKRCPEALKRTGRQGRGSGASLMCKLGSFLQDANL